MNAIEFFVATAAAWGVVYVIMFLYKEKLKSKGVTFYPFFIMLRKDARSEWFPRISKSKFYRALEWVFVVIAFVSAGLGFLLLGEAIYSKYLAPPGTVGAAITPIIPGVTTPLAQAPYILLAIAIAATVHELMHAMSATSNGIKVKGGGVLLLFIFPGAFVEPDEEEYKNADKLKRIKVVAAGIGINFVLGLAFLALLTYAVPAMSQGALITGLVKDYPAYNASVPVGAVIVNINGHAVTTPDQVDKLLSRTEPNSVTFLVNGTLLTKTIPTPLGKLGVHLTYYFPSPVEQGLAYFATWMYIVNFSLAVLNALPLFITDGTKLFAELVGEKGQKAMMYVSGGVLLMLLMALSL
ncbi:MAG: site-2 protease family protein [Thermoprotei archaeon]